MIVSNKKHLFVVSRCSSFLSVAYYVSLFLFLCTFSSAENRICIEFISHWVFLSEYAVCVLRYKNMPKNLTITHHLNFSKLILKLRLRFFVRKNGPWHCHCPLIKILFSFNSLVLEVEEKGERTAKFVHRRNLLFILTYL